MLRDDDDRLSGQSGAECERIESLIVRVAENDCEESVRTEVTRHAHGCEACAEKLAFQRRLTAALGNAGNDAPPQVYFEGVLAEIHRKMPTVRVRVRTVRSPRRFHIRNETIATTIMAALLMVVPAMQLMPQLFSAVTGMMDADGQDRSAVVARYVSVAEPAPRLFCDEGMGLISSDVVKMGNDLAQCTLFDEIRLKKFEKNETHHIALLSARREKTS